MADKRSSLGGWPLLAGWILASSCGWAAGLTAGMSLSLAVSRVTWLNVNEDRFFAYATLISLGLTIGAAQSVLMRRHLPRPILWLAATLIGHLVCLVIIAGGNLVGLAGVGVWDDVVLLGLVGIAIGTCQWSILRRHYRRAGWWVVATAAGFQWFMWMIVNPSHSPGELIIRGTIIGALAAAVPGATLVWLVGQPSAAVSRRTA